MSHRWRVGAIDGWPLMAPTIDGSTLGQQYTAPLKSFQDPIKLVQKPLTNPTSPNSQFDLYHAQNWA